MNVYDRRSSKLSETQKSRLRNGHPVRIKKGSGNQLHLTNEPIKKLESVSRKGAGYPLTQQPEQEETHGSGILGDIYSKMKASDAKSKVDQYIKTGVHSGIDKLSSDEKGKVDQYIKPIEGEGIIGDELKGLIGMTDLDMKKRGRPKKILTEVVNNKVRVRKCKGILSNIIKAVGNPTNYTLRRDHQEFDTPRGGCVTISDRTDQ